MSRAVLFTRSYANVSTVRDVWQGVRTVQHAEYFVALFQDRLKKQKQITRYVFHGVMHSNL